VAFKNHHRAWSATFGVERHISTGATLRILMHQLFGRLDANPNDPRKQKHHGIHFVSGISLRPARLLAPLYGSDQFPGRRSG
jgi:hypothetical protein